ISNNAEFLMPTVVQMELLSHWEVETNPQVKAVKNHPDAMIAASAFIHNAKLISNNNKDFAGITFNFSYRGQPLSYVNPIKDTIAYASFIKSFELLNLPDADNLQENEKES
ncbi:PIN domain nuclease, partial [Priestia megaterium]|nr:PIN domain nuclease [Priestia megaterium]